MAGRSSVARLPKPVKDQVHRLIRDGHTIDEIVAHLEALGAPVSRSAMGRYKHRYETGMARFKEAQEVAGVWVKQLGEDPGSDVGRLIAEMLKTVAFQTIAGMGGDEDDAGSGAPTTMDISLIARAIRDLEHAGKLSDDREMKIRAEVAKQVTKEVADSAEATMREAGLDAEQLRLWREGFLGVRPKARP